VLASNPNLRVYCRNGPKGLPKMLNARLMFVLSISTKQIFAATRAHV